MTSEKRDAYLQIGEVAERTGVTQRTLRFYEEKGLLPAPTRMEGGFRLYSEDDIRRVEQIRRLQGLLGFSLAEIKEMVEAEEERLQLRETARQLPNDIERRRQATLRAIEVTERQRDVIRQKVQQLLEMEHSIEEKLAKYRSWLDELEREDGVSAEAAR
ncbi:MAG TPA: MerR family transcriptional regulator [Dehalococcoidia bacterium]|nr:MerR family transcriptional regulator [Dehalococcoidia bacterium]